MSRFFFHVIKSRFLSQVITSRFLSQVITSRFLFQVRTSRFLSQVITSGFLFQVITSQLKGLFGMTYPGRGFVKIWYGFFTNITTIKLTDMGASLITVAILFFIKVSFVHWLIVLPVGTVMLGGPSPALTITR